MLSFDIAFFFDTVHIIKLWSVKLISYVSRYSRMDHAKIVEDSLSTNFLKAAFTNFTWLILEYLNPYIVEFLKEFFEFLSFKAVHLPFERSLFSIKLVLFIFCFGHSHSFSYWFLQLHILHETLWAICYHLYNFKNVKNTHGGELFLT